MGFSLSGFVRGLLQENRQADGSLPLTTRACPT
jgi:hypothetical protein